MRNYIKRHVTLSTLKNLRHNETRFFYSLKELHNKLFDITEANYISTENDQIS